MTDKIPDWAKEEAAKAIGVPQDDTGWHQTTDIIGPIARALVAAERRGIERAASHLDALAKASPLGHEQPTRGASTYNWLSHCAVAIRQIGGEG